MEYSRNSGDPVVHFLNEADKPNPDMEVLVAFSFDMTVSELYEASTERRTLLQLLGKSEETDLAVEVLSGTIVEAVL
jgi:hypothetical protein